MASKARQSLLGGLFGLSLNLVILSFFMRLCSSGGYDANDVVSHRVSDKEHPAVDKTDSIETHLASRTEVIELDHIRVQEHPRRSSEVDAVLLPVGLFLGVIPFKVHRTPTSNILIFSTCGKTAKTPVSWLCGNDRAARVPVGRAEQIRTPAPPDSQRRAGVDIARDLHAHESTPYPTQNPGSVGSSLPPIRAGAIPFASPAASSVSTATPLSVAAPCAGSKRPDGMPVTKRRSGSSFCMPMIES